MSVDLWSILKIIDSGSISCCRVDALGQDVDGSIGSLPIYGSPIECQPILCKDDWPSHKTFHAPDDEAPVDIKDGYDKKELEAVENRVAPTTAVDMKNIDILQSSSRNHDRSDVLLVDVDKEKNVTSFSGKLVEPVDVPIVQDAGIKGTEEDGKAVQRHVTTPTTRSLAKPKPKPEPPKIKPKKTKPSQENKATQLTKEELKAKKIQEIGKRFSQVFEEAKGGPGLEIPQRVILLPPQSVPYTPSAQQRLAGRSQEMKVRSVHYVLRTPMRAPWPSGFQKVVMASGCFWGLEMAMWKLSEYGVYSTAVGYAAGSTPNPTYEEVCSERTGAAEAVQVIYDPQKISIVDILRWFWEAHDPTQGNGQGNDIGSQYRSGLYYFTEDQHKLMVASRSAYQKALDKAGRGRGPITTEIIGAQQFKESPGSLFYYAEDSHQQYFAKPGRSPYCSAQPLKVALPPFEEWAPTSALQSKYKSLLPDILWEQHGPQQMSHQAETSANIIRQFEVAKNDADWRKQLGDERYEILRSKGTEPPGSGEYDRYFPERGVFRCAACELPVYAADSKFRSDCGWPCFDQVIYSKERGCHVLVQLEQSGLELLCSRCGSHLGHVFFGEKCTARDERH